MSNVDDDMMPAGDSSAHIHLTVKAEDGNVLYFRIRRRTKLKKLMYVYCERRCLDPNSIAFHYDGSRLGGDQTPHELGMCHEDEIGAMLHQTGVLLDAMSLLQL